MLLFFFCFLGFIACAPMNTILRESENAPSWIPFSADQFNHSQLLFSSSYNRSINLFWKIDKTANKITFGVASNFGATWLAVGTSDAGGMLGANIWMLRNKVSSKEINNEKRVYLYDSSSNDPANSTFVLEERFTPIYGAPRLSKTQTLSLLSAYQSDTITAFTFSRPLNGCDDQHVSLSDKKPIWVIYAHGESNLFGKHADNARGQALVDLSGSYFSNLKLAGDQKPDPNMEILNMVAPPVNLKANESTTYCYTYYDFSTFPQKKLIVAENFTIGSKYTHHVLGYLCNKPLEQFKTPGTVLCNNYRPKSMPDYIEFNNTCNSRPYIVWAKGGNPRKYATDMGKPIGPGPLNTQYLIVETHYANPDHDEGAVDAGSGFILTVTTTPRPKEIGMLSVGINVRGLQLSPGGFPSSVNECGSVCTSRPGGVPSSGLTMLSTMIHMHKRGASMAVKHVRGFKELEPLPSMDYFDFNFQSYNYVSTTQQKILPGDRIIANCTFDTRLDTTTVRGGFSSEEEMCLNFIEYYPAIGMTSCLRALSPKMPEVNYCNLGKSDIEPFYPFIRLPFSPWVDPSRVCPKSPINVQ